MAIQNKHMLNLSEAEKAKPVDKIAGSGGINTFRRNVRSSVRGLWTGALTFEQAVSTFIKLSPAKPQATLPFPSVNP